MSIVKTTADSYLARANVINDMITEFRNKTNKCNYDSFWCGGKKHGGICLPAFNCPIEVISEIDDIGNLLSGKNNSSLMFKKCNNRVSNKIMPDARLSQSMTIKSFIVAGTEFDGIYICLHNISNDQKVSLWYRFNVRLLSPGLFVNSNVNSNFTIKNNMSNFGYEPVFDYHVYDKLDYMYELFQIIEKKEQQVSLMTTSCKMVLVKCFFNEHLLSDLLEPICDMLYNLDLSSVICNL